MCVCSAHRHAHTCTRKSEAILWRSVLSFYLVGSMEIKLGSSALKTSSFILRAILAAPDALVSDFCFRHFFMYTFTHTTTPPSPPSQLPFSTTISRMFRPLTMSPMFSHFSKDPPGPLSSPQDCILCFFFYFTGPLTNYHILRDNINVHAQFYGSEFQIMDADLLTKIVLKVLLAGFLSGAS